MEKKSLWHPSKEVPENRSNVLIQTFEPFGPNVRTFRKEYFLLDWKEHLRHARKGENCHRTDAEIWNEYVELRWIGRWLYLDEILPSEE